MVVAGGTFLVCSGCITSLLLLNIIVGEKSRELLGFLRNIGLYESAHWLSWFCASVPLAVVAAIFAAATGKATGLPVFTRVDFSVHFVLVRYSTDFGYCDNSVHVKDFHKVGERRRRAPAGVAFSRMHTHCFFAKNL